MTPLPFPPRSSYPASSHWKSLCGRGWAFCLHPPATAGGPNIPGSVTGSLPPGTTGSRRLPVLTGAHLCKRAGQSPAGQKLGVSHRNKSMQAHTSPFTLVLTAGPSTLPDMISISPHVLLTVPFSYPAPPYPGLISQVRNSHSHLSAPAPASVWRMQLGAKWSADKIIIALKAVRLRFNFHDLTDSGHSTTIKALSVGEGNTGNLVPDK